MSAKREKASRYFQVGGIRNAFSRQKADAQASEERPALQSSSDKNFSMKQEISNGTKLK
jgi:hypothetical protein